jgi:hypothetical protein
LQSKREPHDERRRKSAYEALLRYIALDSRMDTPEWHLHADSPSDPILVPLICLSYLCLALGLPANVFSVFITRLGTMKLFFRFCPSFLTVHGSSLVDKRQRGNG